MLAGSPSTLGRFRILHPLGEGGMGAVYAAEDPANGTRVALKTLVEADGALIYRLKWEFRSLARISHRNLVQLYELFYDKDQARWFFSMELLEDARHFIDFVRGRAAPPAEPTRPRMVVVGVEDQLPPHLAGARAPRPAGIEDFERLRGLFRQLAQGISVLHRHHRLHRDLKPANVLVAPEGRVVILDFGLAVESDGSPQRTLRVRPLGATDHDEIWGSPLYMAPEQAAGGRLTPACDWYAFGVLLFEALTGELPFGDDAFRTAEWKRVHDAPSPASLVSGLPEDLVRLCEQLLGRDPARRPSGEEVLFRLQRAARPPSDAQLLPESDIFVGRQPQLEALAAALQAAREGATVVCHLAGESGAGKTTLLERFLACARGEGAALFAGRCYENESVPFKAVDAVVDSLSRHLLALPEERLRGLLPPGIDALARMFPVLNRVPAIAERRHAAVGAADAAEARRAAFDALADLLRQLGRRDTLVVAIDDLQWTDPESAALLASLLRGGAPPRMLVLLAWRSEPQHQSESMRSIQRLPAVVNERVLRRDLTVTELARADAEALARALLEDAVANSQRFAEWIAAESHGSALFVKELVRHAIMIGGGTPGAIDLPGVIAGRLAKLADDERQLLEVAAVAAQPLRLQDLQRACGRPSLPLQQLSRLRNEQLVKLEGLKRSDAVVVAHDRIRETTVALLAPERRRAIHARLAQALEEGGGAQPEVLAEHWLKAGDEARASRHSFTAATLALGSFAFERAEQLYLQALRLARSDDDRLLVSERLIHLYSDLARFREAYEVARSALRLLRLPLPERFVGPRFALEWARLELRLLGRDPRKLLELPLTSNHRIETAVRLMNAVAKAAYQIQPQLCVWVAVRIVNLCLSWGNTRDCAIGWMVYGAIFKGGILGSYARGHDYGRLALDLVERHGNAAQRAEVNFVVGYFGTSWRRPAVEAERLWEVAYRCGIEERDLFHTGCAAAGIAFGQFLRGVPFDQAQERIAAFEQVLRPAGLAEPLGVLTAIRQAMRNLRGQTYRTDRLDDQEFREEPFAESLERYGSRHFAHCFFILRLQCLWLWRHQQTALGALAQAERFLPDSTGMLQQAEHAFWACLVLAGAARAGERGRAAAAHLHRARQHARRLRRWAAGCAENFRVRSLIAAAAVDHARGDLAAGIAAATLAADLATREGTAHLEAVAALVQAAMLDDRGDHGAAATARERASASLQAWGADAVGRFVVDRS